MNLIDDYTQRLTHSETDICRCNYCTETRGILTELLKKAREKMTEKKRVRQLQDAVNQVIPAVPIDDINAAFDQMMEE